MMMSTVPTPMPYFSARLAMDGRIARRSQARTSGRDVASVELGRPHPLECHAGRTIRRANRFRVRGFELANHPLAIGRQIAAHPPGAVSLQTLVQSFAQSTVIVVGERCPERLFHDQMHHGVLHESIQRSSLKTVTMLLHTTPAG